MIEFSHIYKSYDNRYILRDLNFKVNRGEFIFITGPSGAGKTTTLKLLIALEKPSHGAIKFMDRELGSLKPREIPFLRRRIGFVFQDFKLLPNRTVFQNVALGLQVSGIFGSVINKNVTDILKAVELYIKRDEYPCNLSGGEQQRVAIARALVLNPQVLLADEPTGNLDEDTSNIVIDTIKNFNKKGTTVLFATHDRGLLNQGRSRIIDITKT